MSVDSRSTGQSIDKNVLGGGKSRMRRFTLSQHHLLHCNIRQQCFGSQNKGYCKALDPKEVYYNHLRIMIQSSVSLLSRNRRGRVNTITEVISLLLSVLARWDP